MIGQGIGQASTEVQAAGMAAPAEASEPEDRVGPAWIEQRQRPHLLLQSESLKPVVLSIYLSLLIHNFVLVLQEVLSHLELQYVLVQLLLSIGIR